MLTPAKTWEANGDYSRAIDAYLKMTVMQTTDYALLEEVCRLLYFTGWWVGLSQKRFQETFLVHHSIFFVIWRFIDYNKEV